MARLPLWNKMRQWMGDNEAAAVLKQGHDEDEIYRLYDQWRNGDPFGPKRQPGFDSVKVAAAMEIVRNLGESLRMSAAPQPPVPKIDSRLWAAADEYRARLGVKAPENPP